MALGAVNLETFFENGSEARDDEDLTPLFAGRLAELRGGRATAVLTFAFRLVLQAQRRKEPVAWVARHGTSFYPPDAAEASVDLDGLIVVWVPDVLSATRAADRLLRSGGFGLVAMDLGANPAVPSHALARLGGLAKKHHSIVLCLTEGRHERATLGSLVSIRAEASRQKHGDNRYLCKVRTLKDKRNGPGWKHMEVCHGPHGLR